MILCIALGGFLIFAKTNYGDQEYSEYFKIFNMLFPDHLIIAEKLALISLAFPILFHITIFICDYTLDSTDPSESTLEKLYKSIEND